MELGSKVKVKVSHRKVAQKLYIVPKKWIYLPFNLLLQKIKVLLWSMRASVLQFSGGAQGSVAVPVTVPAVQFSHPAFYPLCSASYSNNTLKSEILTYFSNG